MTLEARVKTRVGTLRLDIELSAGSESTIALLGPNGAGKTTFLRALAGLAPLDHGRITLDGEVLEDTDAGVHVPCEEREIGFVFQDYLLFPHLSIVDNVAFGLRSRGRRRSEAALMAQEQLSGLGIAHLGAARPSEISGGEAQRVALARALAARPRLLLLDEPTAALDAPTKSMVRLDLRQWLTNFSGTRLLVTHDPLEAMMVADHLVIVEGGRVLQQGTPVDIAVRPRSQFVADLAGVNLLRGLARGVDVEVDGGGVLRSAERHDGRVMLVVHPRSVALYRDRPEGSPRNLWDAYVAAAEPLGERVRLRLSGAPSVIAELTAAAAEQLALVPGDAVWVSIKATEIDVYQD